MEQMREYRSSQLGEHYYRMTHKSGLPIYVFPKKLTTAFAYFATRYGSLDRAFYTEGKQSLTEVPDGIAHFLEHKLFENADGSDSFARFAALGADANAYTTYNRTAYLFSCTERFEESLSELLSFVTHPHFTEKSVKKERGIIAEEIRMYEDNPWDRCMQLLLESLYWKHPVRQNICGTVDSIASITPRLLYECHKVFYNPANMALVVAGDVEPETVWRIAEETLPMDFLPREVLRAEVDEPACVRRSYADERMQVAKPLFCIGIKDAPMTGTPEERLRREMALNLMDEIMFSKSGSFYNALFEENLVTQSFAAGYSAAEGFAFHCISGESDDPEAVLERLRTYVASVAENGISEEDFERCRRVMYADELRAYDSTEEIAGRLLSFVFDGIEMFSCPRVLQSMTKHEVEDCISTLLCDGGASLAVIRPLQ